MASDPLFPPLVRKAIIDSILKDSAATEVTKKLFCKPLMCMGARTDRRMGYQAPGVQAMGHGSRALHGAFVASHFAYDPLHGCEATAHAWGIVVTCSALCCAASLAEENVLTATFDIAKSFDDLQLAHKKEVYCTIVTAQVGLVWPAL